MLKLKHILMSGHLSVYDVTYIIHKFDYDDSSYLQSKLVNTYFQFSQQSFNALLLYFCLS